MKKILQTLVFATLMFGASASFGSVSDWFPPSAEYSLNEIAKEFHQLNLFIDEFLDLLALEANLQ